jgi:hypothetical protein
MRLFATIVSTCVLMVVPIASAGADPHTGRIRVLDCGAAGSLTDTAGLFAEITGVLSGR